MKILLLAFLLIIPWPLSSQTLSEADSLKGIKEMSVAFTGFTGKPLESASRIKSIEARLGRAGIKLLDSGYPRLSLVVWTRSWSGVVVERDSLTGFGSTSIDDTGSATHINLEFIQLLPKIVDNKTVFYAATTWSSGRFASIDGIAALVDEFLRDYSSANAGLTTAPSISKVTAPPISSVTPATPPATRPNSLPATGAAPSVSDARGAVPSSKSIPAGSVFTVRMIEAVSPASGANGKTFQGVLETILTRGRFVPPPGFSVTAKIDSLGKPEESWTLALVEITIDGQKYPISANATLVTPPAERRSRGMNRVRAAAPIPIPIRGLGVTLPTETRITFRLQSALTF